MSLTKNKCVRCDKCGKLSRDRDGYYRKPDGNGGHINSRGYNIDQDYCDECAAVLGEMHLYRLQEPGRESTPTPPDETRWELRSARRYGSEHVAFCPDRATAEAEARRLIAAAGNKGRIGCVLEETRTVYFDEYEEDS